VYAFFLEGLDRASVDLCNLVRRATVSGDLFDFDAATGQGLLNRFERAMNCGAIDEDEAVAMTSLTLAELHSKSFTKIVLSRRRT
jgi:hypothetical protein